MAEQQPQPPAGFQRPGIPGAGNILDPAVRGELREKVHAAVHGAQPAAAPEAPAQPAPPAKPEPANEETGAKPASPPPTYRAGPFPHGDVDLRGRHPANVPPGPVRPQRGQTGRRFYFLPATQPAATTPQSPASPPDARKPG